jgi:hypothetical protein
MGKLGGKAPEPYMYLILGNPKRQNLVETKDFGKLQLQDAYDLRLTKAATGNILAEDPEQALMKARKRANKTHPGQMYGILVFNIRNGFELVAMQQTSAFATEENCIRKMYEAGENIENVCIQPKLDGKIKGVGPVLQKELGVTEGRTQILVDGKWKTLEDAVEK